MTHVLCMAEQQNRQAFRLLPATVTLAAHPFGDLLRQGWNQPLLLLGDALTSTDAVRLLQRTYHNPAPLLVLPPLRVGVVTSILDAAAPVVIVNQKANGIDVIDAALGEAVRREHLQIHCAEAIETALQTGVLAAANGKPVIWAYRPTQASTPVIWVAPQLLLVSARTDPLDREDLLEALLTWAENQTRTESAQDTAQRGSLEAIAAEPGLLRAVVLALAVRPDLPRQALKGWLEMRLFVSIDDPELDAALATLEEQGALDVNLRLRPERLEELIDTWQLRAWVREVRNLD